MAKYIQTDSSDQISHDGADTEAHILGDPEVHLVGEPEVHIQLDTEAHGVKVIEDADPADMVDETDTEAHRYYQ